MSKQEESNLEQNPSGITRRNFLKSAGVVGFAALAAGVGLTGCSPKSQEPSSESPAEDESGALNTYGDASNEQLEELENIDSYQWTGIQVMQANDDRLKISCKLSVSIRKFPEAVTYDNNNGVSNILADLYKGDYSLELKYGQVLVGGADKRFPYIGIDLNDLDPKDPGNKDFIDIISSLSREPINEANIPEWYEYPEGVPTDRVIFIPLNENLSTSKLISVGAGDDGHPVYAMGSFDRTDGWTTSENDDQIAAATAASPCGSYFLQ